jgi:hypothetical protein
LRTSAFANPIFNKLLKAFMLWDPSFLFCLRKSKRKVVVIVVSKN